jgi:hypothetical protein
MKMAVSLLPIRKPISPNLRQCKENNGSHNAIKVSLFTDRFSFASLKSMDSISPRASVPEKIVSLIAARPVDLFLHPLA